MERTGSEEATEQALRHLDDFAVVGGLTERFEAQGS